MCSAGCLIAGSIGGFGRNPMASIGWTISWEEFKTYIHSFLIISEEINDGWAWHGDQDQFAGAYIVKKVKLPLVEQGSLPNQDEIDLLEDISCQTEDEQAVKEPNECDQDCTWEYHILYSPSYAAPVLLFNAFTSDGHLLPLEVLWKGLAGGTQEQLQQLRWKALSQQEHPVLRRPYFYLHPCKTAEFLNVHQATSSNPIVTWLSSMGPAIGLHLNIAYGHLVQNKN